MSTFTSSATGIVWLILGFGFLIFVHELGHFLVAKAVGVKVTQFAIGFGHAVFTWRRGMGFRVSPWAWVWAWPWALLAWRRGARFQRCGTEKEFERRIRQHLRDHSDEAEATDEPSYTSQQIDRATEALGLGETEYRLNWMPLGGYVKMLGQEDLDPTALSDDPRSFNAKPVWARACVLSAGVAMNLLFGLIFFVVAFTYGVRFPRAIVGGVAPGAPAALAYAQGHEHDPAYRGLRIGDRVLEIDDKPVQDFMDIAASVLLARRDQRLSFAIRRPGEAETLRYQLQPRVDPDSHLLSIGVDTPVTLALAQLAEQSRLYQAGVRPDMAIAAVAGRPVEAFFEYHRAVVAAAGVPLPVQFTDPHTGQSLTVPLAAIPLLGRDEPAPPNLLGFIPPTRVVALAQNEDAAKQTPAQKAGMREDDLIVQIGQVDWPRPAQIVEQVGLAAKRKAPLAMVVWRDGQVLDLGRIEPEQGQIGIYPGLALDVAIISRTLPGSPAAALNLNGGSAVTSVNGVEVSNWADLQRHLQTAVADAADQGVKVDIGYELNVKGRPKGSAAVAVDTETARQLADAGWDQPISVYSFQLDKRLIKAETATEAVQLGFEKTGQFVIQTYVTIARLFQGTVNITDLRGPVGIIHIGTRIATERWTYMLFFFGLISVNLVVINFLPIPIVDGGLMVFLIIEKLKGSPVSPRILSAVNLAGLVMLGCLFVTLTYFDVMRWATGN